MTDTPAPDTEQSATGFLVRLSNFEGPFDLLLQLIFAHRLDVTEVALHQVTDDFIAYTREIGPQLELEETTTFLVIAATLLDLKAARLLPSGQVDDEEDLALLEVRDLLFARLLQYRAFKEVAGVFAARMQTVGRVVPRQAGLEERFAGLLPELHLGVAPEAFARTAALAMIPRLPPTVGLEHLHAAKVSVREQSLIVTATLRERGTLTFSELVADAESTLVLVARFLVVLELFRDAAVSFDQPEALGRLVVRWTGQDGAQDDLAERLASEYDEPAEGKDRA